MTIFWNLLPATVIIPMPLIDTGTQSSPAISKIWISRNFGGSGQLHESTIEKC